MQKRGTAVVGIRELKAHLSAYLERVAGGARVTVTDRGREVATLAPISTLAPEAWVYTLATKGRARWAGGKPSGLPRRIPSRGKPASAMVIEDRR
jgi:prevent-host-death family protein